MRNRQSRIRLEVEILEDRALPATGLSPSQAFVSQVYVDLLQRPADANGLAYWSGKVDGGTTDASVVLGIEASSEYRTVEVQNAYQSLLKRPADPAGLSYWTQYLAGNSVELMQASIAGSPEYFQDVGQTNDGFVTALYRDFLHRDADAGGQTGFVKELAAGASRTTVAMQIVSSSESRQNVVVGGYSQFLHRPADAGGLSAWNGLINGGESKAQIIAGIVASGEYSTRTPTTPIVTNPANAVSANTVTFTIGGSAEAGNLVQVYRDTNQNGTVDANEPLVGLTQLTGTATAYSVNVPLTALSANNFLVVATNSFGNRSPATVVPTITQNSLVPVVTAPANQTNLEGDVVTGVKVTASSSSGAPLTYLATNLPAGLAINSSTGAISGTIASGASTHSPYLVSVLATDGVNAGNSTFTWTVGVTAPKNPSATVTTTASNPTSLASIPFTVTFSSGVTGFTQAKLAVTNGTVSNFVAINLTTYTFSVAPTADGTVNVSVPAGVATDSLGNLNTAGSTAVVSLRTDAGMTNTIPDITSPNFVPSGANGLKVWNVQTGTGSTAVTANSTITVFYTGYLLNGTVFDSVRSPATPATFPLANLIAGWKQGLIGMKPGGIIRLDIPAALAYGVMGSPPSIPANAELVFEIKLIATT